MRYGFTTGSCAAAAAKAAAYMLLAGREKEKISIETPKGIVYHAKVFGICRGERAVSCAVEKDGGDDPDVTTGAWIYAKVSFLGDGQQGALAEGTQARPWPEDREQEILVEGGEGVGRVTRPGLDQPVGAAAINRVPREMIKKEVLEVCRAMDCRESLLVEISVPKGEELSKRTFNPRLGIVGGISILGTSGIVEPMSSQALLDTIQAELRQRKAMGFDYVAVSPGNYGLDFMKNTYGYDLDKSVKCSHFIGETIDMAAGLGFRAMLLTGHIGKLVKVAGGIMNTHSREADSRMELLAAFAIQEQADARLALGILECATTEEAIPLLKESGKLQQVMGRAAERICYYTQRRAGGRMKVDCILYANGFGELARSREAEKWFILLGQEQGQPI